MRALPVIGVDTILATALYCTCILLRAKRPRGSGPSPDHRLRIWGAVILSATAEAGCRLLLSVDLQDAT